MHKRYLFGAAAALALALAYAAQASAADVSVTNAWFRALPGGLPAGGYFTLHNAGTDAVSLIGAKSSACGMLMLHKSVENSGVSRMMDVPIVRVPAGGTVAFAPGGFHLMCTKPAPALSPGGHVPVTLVFADKSEVAADFAVRSPSGQ
jgi:copper(I)-binding protein